LNATSFDILLQDIKAKKFRQLQKRGKNGLTKIYKKLFLVLRLKFCNLLIKRILSELYKYVDVEFSQIKYRIFPFSYHYSNSVFLATYITRRLVLKYPLREVIPSYLTKHKRKLTALIISTFGRFTRQPRASRKIWQFGNCGYNTFHHMVDFAKRACKLKYGMGGIRVWAFKQRRFIENSLLKAKRSIFKMKGFFARGFRKLMFIWLYRKRPVNREYFLNKKIFNLGYLTKVLFL